MAINKTESFPPQTQDDRPGIEGKMDPKPEYIRPGYIGSNKLKEKVALITGGDSGIGRSIAVHFAREGADVAIAYVKSEQEDAEYTKGLIEKEGRQCLLLSGDLRDKNFCSSIVEETVMKFGKLNVLVNNAANQYIVDDLAKITDDQLEETFDINILSFFRVTRAALKYLHEGDTIINSSSVNAYRGHEMMLDYSSTKGAITAFSRSLALQLTKKKIRVNSVAPGPIWTPAIPATISDKKEVADFGHDVPMKRAGQPSECGPCYVFLASDDSTYITGQALHPNGGLTLNT